MKPLVPRSMENVYAPVVVQKANMMTAGSSVPVVAVSLVLDSKIVVGHF